ncbi:hypothetical protein [Jatrophihabitans sp.]|uniref:hypothetical protein n=1 Tax=Jatrophihabitans sp. TaxID=1932789 RepID=UPI002BFCBFCB|nr:hypothetical protein [Jatrophihabitans sp.]
MKAEPPSPGAAATANRELEMPIDLRAMFSVRLLPRADVPAELADPKARFDAGIWRLEDVDIDGKPYSLVFRSQHSWPAG